MALRRKPPPRRTAPEIHERELGRIRLDLGDSDDIMALLRERTGDAVLQAGIAIVDEPEDLKDATKAELSNVNLFSGKPEINTSVVAFLIGWWQVRSQR